ncbi:MAG: phosphonate ABC transporter, permease protein PhnE [Halorhodospira halophila]|uniref:phosphonate ABC transporter, permease protein PhnE n=1 Tax=Halorhodospira TaxID=85108 RepID=UPI0019134220|nr:MULTISPECIES: phosphonate ABC transporter, permease protein PhnE [Halorhodospira]MBK5942426.1 phosphonate ABC transporter, permease protein PhnE [Halorhodospira halophila]MCC3751863.1 phosphonate ABC transporter, permease protein PhnE [Halorhodospira halophila]MCG5531975.1 phosphonate ABC transporter, permease protein PhnE [Halorhodospira sp. 9621]MCG5537627.1 phosphonate ABC transporter, permease protein PhnE [Halorhodospira sp. 9622]MCG5540036.1 phosphonate ABC transporter, permease prote
MTSHEPRSTATPERFQRPSVFTWVVLVGFLAFLIQGLSTIDTTFERLLQGMGNLGDFFARAVPPDFSRFDSIAGAMLETLNMAVVGVTAGVILSVPMALLCSRNTTPHWSIAWISRGVVATLRTVPELVWALIFVAAVGLGPLAGILAIVMDTIGFAARFFSERIEEIPKGPSEALASTGASRTGTIIGAILPEASASMTATSLYSIEKGIRSAIVLGLVGAGGIGVELSTAMSMFNYDAALAIIIVILLVVIGVEQVSSAIRQRLL